MKTFTSKIQEPTNYLEMNEFEETTDKLISKETIDKKNAKKSRVTILIEFYNSISKSQSLCLPENKQKEEKIQSILLPSTIKPESIKKVMTLESRIKFEKSENEKSRNKNSENKNSVNIEKSENKNSENKNSENKNSVNIKKMSTIINSLITQIPEYKENGFIYGLKKEIFKRKPVKEIAKMFESSAIIQ